MRFGGPIFRSEYTDPQSWIAALKSYGYSAANCPVDLDADDATIAAYARAAEGVDIVIAEVGAWSNPISPDENTRSEALAKCKASLELAEKIGARCCVNITGSNSLTSRNGPHERDLTEETFDRIVGSVREIIDAVKPDRTFYVLETHPRIYPDSPDSYLRLIEAVDRKALAAHFDPVNLISSPQRYYNNAALMEDCFAKLGAHIKACHVKDILLQPELTVHLDEVRPGLGQLDFATFLRLANQLPADTPVMMEHLTTQDEYRLAAEYIRAVARQEGIAL